MVAVSRTVLLVNAVNVFIQSVRMSHVYFDNLSSLILGMTGVSLMVMFMYPKIPE